jgi:CRISPR-associated protein Csb2
MTLVDEPIPLVAEGSDQPFAFAALTGEVDSVFDWYLGAGPEWVTVTPMILPGDYTRGWTLVRKLVRKALRETGFTPEEVADITASKVPMIAGAKHAHAYRRKVNSGKSYSYHVRVRFSRPVIGPIWIGRQRHQGLGIMARASAGEM